MWKCAGAQEWSIMPSGVFSQSEVKSWFNDRWILSFLSIVCFLMFFSLMFLERKFLKLHWAGSIITLIVLLGGALRFYQYNIIPLYNETMDEFLLGWMGWSLLKLGIPVGWSWLPAYGDWSSACRFWFGNVFQILSPALHQPPLFYTLIGAVSILSGAKELLQVTVSSMRILPVIFSTTTIFLIYFFLKDKFGRRAALLSSLLFAVIPTIVVSGRLVKGENMISFLLVLSLILYDRSLHSTTCRKPFWIGVILGLACLAKFTALSFVVAMCFLYLFKKNWKQGITVFCVGAFFASLYFVYGAFIDWGIFVRAFNSQRDMLSLLDMPIKMILQPKITDTVFFDGGILFLWVSIICISFLRDKGIARDIGIIFAFYFLSISVNVWSKYNFGWYRIPLYPLLCAGGGIVLHELFRRKSVLLMAMFIGLGVMMNLQYCLPDHLVRNLLFPKFLVAALIFPILPWQIWKTRFCNYLAVSGITFVVLVYVITSIIMVLKFSGIY
ncbi:glycosyltransferase family 39 protein [candidate division WOR-3 bacterium]|nr:glycosyltransferase family 39 protein [candidate division WOR-3 bacterium]